MIGTRTLLFMTLLAAVVLAQKPQAAHANTGADKLQNCEINRGACSSMSGTLQVTLDVTPKPVKAMQELTFTVNLKGAKQYDSLKLQLEMVGMYMGPNEVTLVRTGPGSYSGKGVIPRCHSGKKLWSAAVTVPGEARTTPFTFNVQY